MMINSISQLKFNAPVYTSTYRRMPHYSNNGDSFEISDEYKMRRIGYNYAPSVRETLQIQPYYGPMNKDAGFSTEDPEYGGGWLSADIHTPLSTTGVRTCALLNLVNEDTGEQVLYHVYDATKANKIEKFIREKCPNFTYVNIVGGDQYKTVNTMRKIIQAVDNVNRYAPKNFYFTVSDNPELVAYEGEMFYMPDKSGTLSFIRNDENYWY